MRYNYSFLLLFTINCLVQILQNADAAIMSSECISVVAIDSEGKFAGFNMGEVKRLPFGITKSDVKHSRFQFHLYILLQVFINFRYLLIYNLLNLLL